MSEQYLDIMVNESEYGTQTITRTKTEFRAKRELVGLTQKDIADAIGVDITTVKRWEGDGQYEPSEDAWDVLDRTYSQLLELIKAETEKYREEATSGKGSSPVHMVYYRSQEQYDAVCDALGNKRQSYLQYNARCRARAVAYETLGIGYRFVPFDDGILEQISAGKAKALKGDGTSAQAPKKTKPVIRKISR